MKRDSLWFTQGSGSIAMENRQNLFADCKGREVQVTNHLFLVSNEL